MEEPARVVGAISVKVSGLEQFKKPGTQVIVYVRTVAAAVFGETVTTRPRLGVVVLRAGNLGLA
jgi:hypothetical protein